MAKQQWKVFFESDFWHHSGRDHAGKELRLDKEFEWAGHEWHIPAVYCCGKGLAVDFCTVSYTHLDVYKRQHVVSDCWAIADFHEHHKVTKTPLESAALAMNNGCDINCGCTFPYLRDAVRGGYVDEARLDEAVTNLMECRMKLGILGGERQADQDAVGYDQVDTPENRRLNLEAARKSLVLLKNENHFLPLDKNKIRSVGVIGPNADSRKALVGNYEGTASRYITVLELSLIHISVHHQRKLLILKPFQLL